MSRAKDMRGQLEESLEILAVKLDLSEYTKVTSIMTMMFVGHTFEMSDDGFELINLITKTVKTLKNKLLKKLLKRVDKVTYLSYILNNQRLLSFLVFGFC